jgi:hypothetical protein
MGNPVKVITVETLDEKIIELEIVRNKIKEALTIECKGLEDTVLQKYIELQGAMKVAEYLNNEGYRIRSNGKLGERKYNSNDITDIINTSDKDSEADKTLRAIAKALYKFNISKAAWITVVRLFKGL